MVIQTKRLRINYANIDDIDDMYEYVSNEDVMKYEREEYPTKESYLEILKLLSDNKLLFAVRRNDDPKVIGHIFLGKTNPAVNNEYNIGYIFNPKYQNKGYCTEASKAVVDYGFLALHANRIRAACNPENTPSWRVMEKIGLKKEGLLKKRFFIKNDQYGNPIYTDEVIYGLHISDWIKDPDTLIQS